MKSTIVLLSFCLSFFTAISQTEFGSGYIVKNNHDTLRGYLGKTIEEDLCKKVRFKTDPAAAEQVFFPRDLNSFWVDNDLFVKIPFRNTSLDNPADDTTFAKLIVRGYYELYTFTDAERRFYIVRHDTASFLLYNTVYSSRAEYQQQGNYQSRLVLLQRDYPKVVEHYQNSVGYSQKDMSDYFVYLNNAIVPGSSSSLYHKGKTKTEFYVYLGGLPLGAQSQITGEAQFRFSSPKISRQTFLTLGVHYSRTITTSDARTPGNILYTAVTTHEIYSIPLTIQYNFTQTRFRPYVYGGISAYHLSETTDGKDIDPNQFLVTYGAAFVAGAGIEMRIVKGLFIRADYRYEWTSQFPSVGIQYQFK